MIFRADDEQAKLLPLIKHNIAGLVGDGAIAELEALARHRRDAKQFEDEEEMEQYDVDTGDILQLHIEAIPPAIRRRIRHAVDE